MKYRDHLPQLNGDLFLTDGGIDPPARPLALPVGTRGRSLRPLDEGD